MGGEININLSKNLEVQKLLRVKEQNKEKILKFTAPKIIITNDDLNGINKNNIKHIELDLSIKAIQENIFYEFKNQNQFIFIQNGLINLILNQQI